ncbi:unnamed protein product, partial [Rotaria sp. Silwood1]
MQGTEMLTDLENL